MRQLPNDPLPWVLVVALALVGTALAVHADVVRFEQSPGGTTAVRWELVFTPEVYDVPADGELERPITVQLYAIDAAGNRSDPSNTFDLLSRYHVRGSLACRGDLNSDGAVALDDLAILFDLAVGVAQCSDPWPVDFNEGAAQ